MKTYKEYAILTKKPDGTITHTGFGHWYTDFEDVKARFEYVKNDWREFMKEEVAKEEEKNKRDSSFSNWAYMSWKEKKDDKFMLVERDVTPYRVLEEEA